MVRLTSVTNALAIVLVLLVAVPTCTHARGNENSRVRIAGAQGLIEVDLDSDGNFFPFCADNWTRRDCDVLCRQVNVGRSGPPNKTTMEKPKTLLVAPGCRGDEDKFELCRNMAQYYSDAKMLTVGAAQCTSYSVSVATCACRTQSQSTNATDTRRRLLSTASSPFKEIYRVLDADFSWDTVISLSGITMVVSFLSPPKVSVYKCGGSNGCSHVQNLPRPGDPFQYTGWGFSLAIYENQIVVGAPFTTVNNLEWAGAVWVYKKRDNRDKWDLLSEVSLKSPTPRFFGQFGHNVALSADGFGSIGVSEFNDGHIGKAYTFEGPGYFAHGHGKILNPGNHPEYDFYGDRIEMSGNHVVVSAPRNSRAYVFLYQNFVDGYSLSGVLKGDVPCCMGDSIAVNSYTTATFAVGNGVESAVYMFYDGQFDRPAAKISGVGVGEYGGGGLALTNDGALYVGVPKAIGNRWTGGTVAVHEKLSGGSTWNTKPKTVFRPTDGKFNNFFGRRLGVSEDGKKVAVGAPGSASAGRAYLFFDETALAPPLVREFYASSMVEDVDRTGSARWIWVCGLVFVCVIVAWRGGFVVKKQQEHQPLSSDTFPLL